MAAVATTGGPVASMITSTPSAGRRRLQPSSVRTAPPESTWPRRTMPRLRAREAMPTRSNALRARSRFGEAMPMTWISRVPGQGKRARPNLPAPTTPTRDRLAGFGHAAISAASVDAGAPACYCACPLTSVKNETSPECNSFRGYVCRDRLGPTLLGRIRAARGSAPSSGRAQPTMRCAGRSPADN